MAFQFNYAFCNQPNFFHSLEEQSQKTAAKDFQLYKKHMKQNNENPDTSPHMVSIAVTDYLEDPVEVYTRKCVCTGL